MQRGWFAVWRKVEDSVSWSRGIEYRGLMITILQKANWKPGFFMGKEIKPGQFATSAANLAQEVGISRPKCQRMLSKLCTDGFIRVQNVSNRFTLISLVNWELYQNQGGEHEQPVSNQRATGEQPVSSRRAQSNKVTKKQGKKKEPPYPLEGGNDILTPETQMPAKKKKKRFEPPTVKQVSEYCKSRNNGIDPEYFVDFYASKGWMVGKNKMKDWRASVRTWERSETGRDKPRVSKTPGIKAKYCDENGNFDINKIL